jgi:hypothetical protein
VFQTARKHQLAVLESALQTSGELAAKHTAQYLNRKEERVARVNPVLAIARQTTGWNHTVNMRMMLEVLAPGMEHSEEADVRPKMFRTGSNLQKCGSLAPSNRSSLRPHSRRYATIGTITCNTANPKPKAKKKRTF